MKDTWFWVGLLIGLTFSDISNDFRLYNQLSKGFVIFGDTMYRCKKDTP